MNRNERYEIEKRGEKGNEFAIINIDNGEEITDGIHTEEEAKRELEHFTNLNRIETELEKEIESLKIVMWNSIHSFALELKSWNAMEEVKHQIERQLFYELEIAISVKRYEKSRWDAIHERKLSQRKKV